ncbi:MAG: protein-L-isoaspartate O-methyltransferase [Marinovum sp.]|nr:protein-L-isoaspartate O-methyltransferase [Marinovum sp.]
MSSYDVRRTTMVATQVRPSDVTKFPVIDAMLAVPRERFVPRDLLEAAYIGENLSLSDERSLLEPRTFAKMLDALDIQREDLVLDVACGYGYSSAVIGHIAEAVVAVESDNDMAAEAQVLLAENGADGVAVHHGPLQEGAAQFGPFDVICIQGGVETVSETIIDQLKEDGRIACLFMDGPLGEVRIGYKHARQMNWRRAFNASAPLLDEFKLNRTFSF